MADVKVEWMHLLPTQFADNFRNAGITDEMRSGSKYGWEMPWQNHRGEAGLHPEWNTEWNRFFTKNSNRTLKPLDVENQLKKMTMDKRFLDNLNKGAPAKYSYAAWKKIKDAAIKKSIKAVGKRGVVKFVSKLGKHTPIVGIIICVASGEAKARIQQKGWIDGTMNLAADNTPIVGWIKFGNEMLSDVMADEPLSPVE